MSTSDQGPLFNSPILISTLLLAAGIFYGIINPKRRTVTLTHAKDNQLLLTSRRSTKIAEGKEKAVALADLCRTTTPSTCNLNPFLPNGDLQTMWTVVGSRDIPIYYKRKVFESDSFAGRFAVDFVVDKYTVKEEEEEEGEDVTDKARRYTLPSGLPPRTTLFTADELSNLPSSDTKPMLVILHGLAGGSHEAYLRCVVEGLQGKKGWEACVVNSRGCAQMKLSSGVLYNARATWDVRQVVKWLRRIFPNRPLFGIGFSLGANILANVCSSFLLFSFSSVC